MNKGFMTAIVVVAFLVVSYLVEIAIDRWRPQMSDLARCGWLIGAAVLLGAIAFAFLEG